MDEETLRRLWEITIPGAGDFAGLDPEKSYRPRPPAADPPPAEESTGGSSAGPLVLPLFSVREGHASSVEEIEAGHFTTIMGVGSGTGSPSGTGAATVDPGPQSGGTGATSRPTPSPAPSVIKDSAGRAWSGRVAATTEDRSAGQSGFLYQLRDVVGRGGMGVVYRAHQSSLQRDVAVKKIIAERAAPELQNRFLAEALVTGRLDHPNVVPVYDLGVTPAGETVLAMKLVEGTSWKRLLRPRTDEEKARAEKLDLTAHLGILKSVGNAVAFAHSRNLCHLDLKPDNVMLGEFGEVLVMDWGLALEISPEPIPGSPIPHRTQLKAPCGTPAYMPPELAEGRGQDIGPWTDVYLLGAILHELLTGRPPHRGGSFKEIVFQAIRAKPPELPADVPQELVAICTRALARDTSARFQSVGELQQALDEHLSHRESLKVAQRAGDRLVDCQRAAGRLLGRIHGPMPISPEEVERERSRLYADYAESVAGFAQARLLWAGNEQARRGEQVARLSFAEAALLQNDLGLAEAQLADVDPESRAGAELRQRVEEARRAQSRSALNARILRASLATALVAIVTGLTLGIWKVQKERNNALEAEERSRREAAEAQHQREIAEGQERRANERRTETLLQQADLLGHSGRWSEARERLEDARASLEELRLPTLPAELGAWQADRWAPLPLHALPASGLVRATAFVPRSGADPLLLLAGSSGEVWLWDALRGLARASWKTPVGNRALAVDPAGRRAAGGGEDGTIRVWELPAGRELATLAGHQGPVTALAWSQSGEVLVSGGADGTVRTWRSQAQASSELGHGTPERPAAVTGLAVIQTRLGPAAFSSGADGRVCLWRLETGARSEVLDYEGPPLLGIAWGLHPVPGEPEDELAHDLLALATDAHEVHLLALDPDPRDPQKKRYEWRERKDLRLRPHRGPVTGVAFSPGGRWLVSCSQDGLVVATDLAVRALRPGRAAAVGGALHSLAVDDHLGIVAAGGDRLAGVWDLGLAEGWPGGDTEREARALEAVPDRPAISAALSPDGALAAAGTAEGPSLLWHVASGRHLAELVGHDEGHGAAVVRFLPGDRLLTAGSDGRVCTYDLTRPDVPIATAQVGRGRPAVAPAADLLAVVVADRGVVIHGLPRGEERRELPIPDATCAGFSPRGGLVLVGRRSGSPVLHEVGSGREVQALLPRHPGPIGAVAIAPDGTRALSGSEDGLVRVWDLSQRQLVFDLRGHAAAVLEVGFSADGALAWSAAADGSWRLWEVGRGRELRAFAGDPVVSVELTRDGRRAIGAGRDGTVRVWSFDRPAAGRALSAALERSLAAARDRTPPALDASGAAALARWLAFRGADRLALSVSEEGLSPAERFAARWELGQPNRALRDLEEAARAGSESPLSAGLAREALRRAAVASGDRLGQFRGEPDSRRVRGIAFSPDGKRVAATCQTGDVVVYDPAARLVRRELATAVPWADPLALAWSAESDRLWVGDARGRLRVFDPASGALLAETRPLDGPAGRSDEQLRALAGLAGGRLLVGGERTLALLGPAGEAEQLTAVEGLDALAVSADGRRLVVSDGRQQVQVWDLERKARLHAWKATDDAQGLALSADGSLLLVAMGKQAEVWRPGAEAPERVLAAPHEARIYALALSHDGATALTADANGRVVVWDARSGEVRWQAEEPRLLLTAAIAPDGSCWITGGGDGTLTVWEHAPR